MAGNKEVAEDIRYIITGVLVAVIVYVFLGLALGTGNPIVSVVSSSMEPNLHVGDMLVLRGIDIEDIQVGDIIVYFHPSRGDLVVHRVFEKYDNGTFRTKGDNPVTNQVADPWIVQPDWVRGKVFLRFRYLGYPRLMLNQVLRSL